MRVMLASIALLLAACGQSADTAYTPQYEFGFMQSCEAGSASPELCACIWDEVEANVPRGDFDALERMPAAERGSQPLSRQIEGYAMACAANLPPPAAAPVEPAPAP